MQKWDTLWTGARLATFADNGAAYGLIDGGAIATQSGDIVYAGPESALPGAPHDLAAKVIDVGGALITPGLIDCHTHLIYGGNRAGEFEARLLGKSYEEIARAGGGIASTVKATRAASEEQLVAAALPRLDDLIAEGATTVEIKSGYGLDTHNELKMLRVARALETLRPVTIRTTLLAAHALPSEFAGRADDYIDHICNEILPAAAQAGLADAVDGFCENIGFSRAQIERVFDAAAQAGLPVKLHAEQLSNQRGAELAADRGALSADHLEYLDADGVAAMTRAGTIAVLLPGAFYYLREQKLPPVQALRDAGVALAVATDCNPGTSPMTSILLAVNMACTLFRLTPEEALAGATREAARALGLGARIGTLEVGKQADFAIWDVDHPAELAYGIGMNRLNRRVFKGAS